jgi:hypothetical protein
MLGENVKQVFRVVAVLTAVSIQPAGAQAPMLTNADVSRLVAMHVSEQTVIAVIQEATATQFDLSPRAVSELAAQLIPTPIIAAMRQPSPRKASSANAVAPSPSSPTPRTRTLAEAAADAAAEPHTWQVPATGAAPAPSVTAGSASAKTASTSTAPAMTPHDLETRRWACVTSLKQDSHLAEGEAIGACKINSSKEYYLCVYGLANDAQVDGNLAANACFANRSRAFINCVYQAAKNVKGDKRAIVDRCMSTGK